MNSVVVRYGHDNPPHMPHPLLCTCMHDNYMPRPHPCTCIHGNQDTLHPCMQPQPRTDSSQRSLLLDRSLGAVQRSWPSALLREWSEWWRERMGCHTQRSWTHGGTPVVGRCLDMRWVWQLSVCGRLLQTLSELIEKLILKLKLLEHSLAGAQGQREVVTGEGPFHLWVTLEQNSIITSYTWQYCGVHVHDLLG